MFCYYAAQACPALAATCSPIWLQQTAARCLCYIPYIPYTVLQRQPSSTPSSSFTMLLRTRVPFPLVLRRPQLRELHPHARANDDGRSNDSRQPQSLASQEPREEGAVDGDGRVDQHARRRAHRLETVELEPLAHACNMSEGAVLEVGTSLRNSYWNYDRIERGAARVLKMQVRTRSDPPKHSSRKRSQLLRQL